MQQILTTLQQLDKNESKLEFISPSGIPADIFVEFGIVISCYVEEDFIPEVNKYELDGNILFRNQLLEDEGFHVVEIDYRDWIALSSDLDRRVFLLDKLQQCRNPPLQMKRKELELQESFIRDSGTQISSLIKDDNKTEVDTKLSPDTENEKPEEEIETDNGDKYVEFQKKQFYFEDLVELKEFIIKIHPSLLPRNQPAPPYIEDIDEHEESE